MNRVQADLVVGKVHGVHGRVATQLAEIAAAHRVHLAISQGEDAVCCRSILDILALAQGTPVCVLVEGAEAEAALKSVVQLLTTRDDP